ncbi:Alpha/Beta hydrolase protein [Crassisporium funariophilum]|nr:Alpha/Beta hydrolase protein [Crassisporium funariophilum]
MADIPYASDADPFRQFDLYEPEQPSENLSPLICFIHGGAWRAEDKRDHGKLARSLVIATGCPVAVPNYRLTPTTSTAPAFHHPQHAQDILLFLNFILAWDHPAARAFDPHKLILIGHSCSAHMLASIFLDSADVSPTLAPSQELLRSVKAIVMSEGIYDLDLLMARFPDYRDWFIQPAFGPSPSYAEFSVLNYPLRAESEITWLLIHSKGDTLVDLAQSDAMYKHLSALDPQRVVRNVDQLEVDHDDIFSEGRYVEIFKEFTSQFM